MSTSQITIPGRSMTALLVVGALAFAALAPAAALAADGTASQPGEEAVDVYTAEDNLGTYLVGPEQMTLYYYTRDVHAGESRCHGRCATAWPPLLVEDGWEVIPEGGVEGTVGIVERGDGTQQATHRGRPLYYFAGDDAPGDTRGHGLGDTWFVALADGSLPPDPPMATLQAADGELGTYLTDADGMTLYFFAADTTPGVSECVLQCLDAWPPLTVPGPGGAVGGAGVTGVVSVAPGQTPVQVTYDGRPLYYYAGDAAPGDTNGHGLNDVWYVASVDGHLPFE